MFGIFKTKPQQTEKEYHYTNSPTFRGTKRYNIVTYGDKESMQGLDSLSDIKDAEITFKEIKDGLSIFVNSVKIGAIFREDQAIDKIRNNAEIVHIRIDKENVNGQDRNKAYLFVK